MTRPEHILPAELFYDEKEAYKYTNKYRYLTQCSYHFNTSRNDRESNTDISNTR